MGEQSGKGTWDILAVRDGGMMVEVLSSTHFVGHPHTLMYNVVYACMHVYYKRECVCAKNI